MKRVLVLGAGNFGYSWITEVLPKCSDVAVLAGVADRSEEALARIPAGIPVFPDLDEALAAARPELVINVTPPGSHTPLNKMLLDRGLPILCEKPAAADREDLRDMMDYLARSGGFLMIGENYRYSAVFRKAREVLAAGELGSVHAADCLFRHYHPDYSQFYHGSLKHPLLMDVTVHHLDLARFLTGENPITVTAREWPAPYSWYGERPANVNIFTSMTGGVMFSYVGTLASPVSLTDWYGDWQIECDRGVLKITDSRLFIADGGGTREIECVGDADSRPALLREAIAALEEGRQGETDIADNSLSFLWMEHAIKSSEEGRTVECTAL